MNNVILFVAIIISCKLSFGQLPQDQQWINRVNVLAIDSCEHRTKCFSEVYVEVNKALLSDSSKITLIIGSQPAMHNIYYRKYIYTEGFVENNDSVRLSSGGNPEFFLGTYFINRQFFIDSFVE